MNMQLKNRKEMDQEYQWDLSPIFKDSKAWKLAYEEAEQEVETIGALAGTLTQSPENMKAGLDKIYQTLYKVDLVYRYASLQKSGDNSDPEYQKMEGMATNLYVAMSTACAFVDPEILSMPEEQFEVFLNEPCLASYRHILEDTNRARSHTLDEKGEKLLAMLADAADTPDNCFTRMKASGLP